MASDTTTTTELRDALRSSKKALIAVGILSAVLNILLLGGPIYMLLIYDSVMPSNSIPTLMGLLILIAGVYVFQGLFDILRNRILADVAGSLDLKLSNRIHQGISALKLSGNRSDGDGLTPMRDLDAIRGFLSGPGPGALIDLPWIMFFLALLTLLHVWLGVTAFVGACILIVLTALNSRVSQPLVREASAAQARRSLVAQDNRANVEMAHALGMKRQMHRRWEETNAEYLTTQDRLARAYGIYGGISKVFRMFLQSVVLTVGALLYIYGEASGGIVFAASILATRALAPVDQAIANWRGFTAARQGWERLEKLLTLLPEEEDSITQLPAPESELTVQKVAAGPAGLKKVTLQGVDFALKAGDGLGIIGPSAVGKSTLARTLVGIWPALSGSVRLDGATLDQWDSDTLGRYLGYMPQQVDLIDGTIAQNIARFRDDMTSEAVIAAAQAAHVHDMIVGLPDGYETVVGTQGTTLSAGQRQRIGLARALYDDPFLIVLDEPNSNLDTDGEAALERAVAAVRGRGGIVIVIAHRPSALSQVNYVLYLRDGKQAAFGPKQEVLEKILAKPQPVDGPAGGKGQIQAQDGKGNLVTTLRPRGASAQAGKD